MPGLPTAAYYDYRPVFSDNTTLYTWQLMNQQYVLNGTPFITSTTSTSTNWIIPTYTSTTANAAYMSWVNRTSYNVTSLSSPAYQEWNERIHETQEERAARERRYARLQIRNAAISRRMKRQRDRADTLAGELLLACLSPEQVLSHLNRGFFDVIGSRGNRFRIHTTSPVGANSGIGQSGNVVLLDHEEKHQARYCVHPPDGLPHADAWLAQKLALEADEDTVLAVANLPWQRPGHVDIRPAARERLRLVRSAA